MKSFFDTKNEKITEKAFSQSLLISVVSILLCIVVLCSITYAWFTTNVTSGVNVIESSRFALVIDIISDNEETLTLSPDSDGTFTCSLDPGTYTVVLTMTDDTTASKGYCEITVDSTEKKQTTPISDDTSVGNNPFKFTIIIEGNSKTLVFEPKWGISAYPDVVYADTLLFGSEPDITNNIQDAPSDDE